MSKRHIQPDAPLPMEIPDSPRWPLSRALPARDASAEWLCARAAHIEDLSDRASYRSHVRLIARTARQRNIAFACSVLRARQDWRAYAELQRLVLLSRWVRHLAPPPQNLALAA